MPDLATEWAWSDDGKDLTFKLREGVKWHDGKPFTSADVKCTWDMLIGGRGSKLRKNPRKSWWFNLKEVTTNGDYEVTFHLDRPQPSLLTMLAGAFSPVYPCHVRAAQMRTKPIGTGPFKFAELKQNESIKLVTQPRLLEAGPALSRRASSSRIIPNRATSLLAFVAGKFDLTFTAEIAAPLLKDLKAQAPWAICEMLPTNTQANLLVNRDKPPFDNAQVRKAMVLAIDRKAFTEIIGQGTNRHRRHHAAAAGRAAGACRAEFLATVPGYGADHEKSRAEGRKIMGELGYSADKPLRIKVSTRNIADLSRPGGDPDRPSQAGLYPGRARAARNRRLVQPHGAQGLHRRPERPGRRHRRSRRGVLRDLRLRLGAQLHRTIAIPRSRSCSTSSRA